MGCVWFGRIKQQKLLVISAKAELHESCLCRIGTFSLIFKKSLSHFSDMHRIVDQPENRQIVTGRVWV